MNNNNIQIIEEVLGASWMPRRNLRQYLNGFFDSIRSDFERTNLNARCHTLTEFLGMMDQFHPKNCLIINKRYVIGENTTHYHIMIINEATQTSADQCGTQHITRWVNALHIHENAEMQRKVQLFELTWHWLRTEEETYSFPCPSNTINANVHFKTQNNYTWDEAAMLINNRAAIRTPPAGQPQLKKRKSE